MVMQDPGDSLAMVALRGDFYTFGDWLMSSCLQSSVAADDMYRLLAASCLMLAAKAGNSGMDLPSPADIEASIGMPVRSLLILQFLLHSECRRVPQGWACRLCSMNNEDAWGGLIVFTPPKATALTQAGSLPLRLRPLTPEITRMPKSCDLKMHSDSCCP